MPLTTIDIEQFLADRYQGITIDSRSESEYHKAHIPGALNFPILVDEARIIVGTIYKEQGKHAAVVKGFELSGPRFASLILDITKEANGRAIYLYCWRGGMRSNIMAWILNLAGLEVYLLNDGYKSFRHHVLESFDQKLDLIVLGGKTGSGKSDILQQIRSKGEQILDLESLASHKGSAFGALGMPPQPSIEQFENLLATEIRSLDISQKMWVENESRQIGTVNIPDGLFAQIRNAPVVELQRSTEQRITRIIRDYGKFPVEILEQRTIMVRKRLGPDRTQSAIEFLKAGDLEKWVEMLLLYYDKTYLYGLESRSSGPLLFIDAKNENDEELASIIISETNKIIPVIHD